jgi:uncharacterized protein with HEPN domain
MRHDQQRLHDILQAARAILEFAAHRSETELEQDALFQSAVLYQLCTIGEAANHVSDALKIKYPQVSWVSLNRFRNRIAHEYFSIQLEIVLAEDLDRNFLASHTD